MFFLCSLFDPAMRCQLLAVTCWSSGHPTTPIANLKTTMSSIQITLPDGSVKAYPAGTSPFDVARSISNRLADDAIVARVLDAVAAP